MATPCTERCRSAQNALAEAAIAGRVVSDQVPSRAVRTGSLGRTDERVYALGGRRLIQALLLQQPGPGQLQRSGVCERHCLGIQRPLEGKAVPNLRHAGHASEAATGNTGFRGYVSLLLDHRPRQEPLPATRPWICAQMPDPETLGAIDLICDVRCATSAARVPASRV